MHAKVFYVEWKTSSGRRAHSLVYGSGNATRQAFHGGINAELMCRARLTAANHQDVLDWVRGVRDAVKAARNGDVTIEEARDIWLAEGISVRLPKIVVKDATTKAHNFDLWLQRGRLAAVFRPDPSFLRVHINLLAELPPGALEQMIQNEGFETPRTKRLSIPYPQNIGHIEDAPDGSGHWRSRYFALTQLGDWCSGACYADRKRLFRKAGHEGRLHILERLEELKESGCRKQARDHYLDRIRRLWTALGENAGTYLSSDGGMVDLNHYGQLFEQRVDYDLDLAADEEFRTRFIDGVEIIDVPRFRIDTGAWNTFVMSFARQLHLENLKRRSVSLIYQRIGAALGELGLEEDPFDDPRELINVLRENWGSIIEGDEGEEVTVGEYIDGYHKHGNSLP
ncbi:hypothetical protein [Microvirga sp. VF16]|uniref:hypothetical protein n=1 Tax=Microvirga sp. VF16 TaxID=2807101 RepID=UPI00193D4A4A|nr:hypothetical protein [Microvirga sp. VF16]QRM36040.1 hypothetical protein JO965_45510 [Microvirga sp. VF16]